MIIKKVFKKVYHLIYPPRVRFKHGQRFYSNSLIDTLFPELVEIGDDFISAPGSIILAHDASTLWHTGKYRVQKTKIGNRVFLGANSIILPGVVVGDDVQTVEKLSLVFVDSLDLNVKHGVGVDLHLVVLLQVHSKL